MTFRTRRTGTAIPVRGTLLSVRHQEVAQPSDLQSLRSSDKRIWMRILDAYSAFICILASTVISIASVDTETILEG